MMGGMGRAVRRRLRRVHLRAGRARSSRSAPTLDWATLGAVPGDAADRLRLAHRRPGRAAGPDAADPRRHLLGRHGRRRAGQGPRADRARDHPPPRAALDALASDRRRPRAHRRRRRRRPGARDRARAASTPRSSWSAPPRCRDTLRATRVHGVVCFTGMLSNQWTVPDFYPIDYIPTGVRLTAYGGEASGPARRRPAGASSTTSPPAGSGADRPRLRPRRDRHGARRHGAGERRRQARRPRAGLSRRAARIGGVTLMRGASPRATIVRCGRPC